MGPRRWKTPLVTNYCKTRSANLHNASTLELVIQSPHDERLLGFLENGFLGDPRFRAQRSRRHDIPTIPVRSRGHFIVPRYLRVHNTPVRSPQSGSDQATYSLQRFRTASWNTFAHTYKSAGITNSLVSRCNDATLMCEMSRLYITTNMKRQTATYLAFLLSRE